MEGAHVVVLEVDLDEGLPVVIALVHFHPIEHVARKIEFGTWTHVRQVCFDVDAVVFEQQAVPFVQGVVAQVKAGVLVKVGCAQQRARHGSVAGAVSPAVQGAHDVATGFRASLGGATAPQNHGLAVATHVGNQLYTLGRAQQGTPFAFLR